MVTLSDNWRPTRHLTLTPSLSHVYAKAGNSAGDDVINKGAWAPGLAGVWDATHDGRTAIRGSVSSYVDLDIGAVARHTIGGQAQQRCLWNAANRHLRHATACSAAGHRATPSGCPAAPPASTRRASRCRQALEGAPHPRAHARRRARGHCRASRCRSIWSTASSTTSTRSTRPTGSGTSGGTRLDPLGGYRNGRAETILDLGTPDGGRAALRRRQLRAHQAGGSLQGQRLLHLEQAPGDGRRAARTTPGATSRDATSSSTATCPTITATPSRPRWATRRRPGCRSAAGPSTPPASPTTGCSATPRPPATTSIGPPGASTPGTNINDPDRRPRAAPPRPARDERPGPGQPACRSSAGSSTSTSTC